MPIRVRIILTFLVGMAIYIGLPIVAWGLGDLGGFMGHPARLGYVALSLLLSAYAALKNPEVGKERGRETKIVARQRIAVVLLQILTLAFVIIGPFCDRRGVLIMGHAGAIRYVGLGAFAFGFIVMHLAEMHLGRQFSIQVSIQEGHTLVTDGPYRFIRHPRYLGILFFSLGLALIFRSWLTLILIAPLKLVLLWRIHDEEALMHREFGTEWEAYARKTRRLVPFVY